MRFSAYVYRQRSREMLTHFSRLYYTTDVEGTGPQGRLQAQGHVTSFVLKHRGPGHSISHFLQDIEF